MTLVRPSIGRKKRLEVDDTSRLGQREHGRAEKLKSLHKSKQANSL